MSATHQRIQRPRARFFERVPAPLGAAGHMAMTNVGGR